MKRGLEAMRGWPLAIVVLLAATGLLLGPSLVHGAGSSHSYLFNAAWTLEFSDALARGQFPPRWLHGAFHGLGAPSFYYYPPLAFYVTSAVRALLGPGADHAHILAWASYAMTAASGLTMFAWLRGKAGDGWALAGAVAYVIAPYHQVDYFVRGALGETAAYAVAPFVMLALERAAASWRWIPGLAFAYTLLITAHLVIAMLISVGVISIFAAWLVLKAPGGQRLAVAARGAAGAVLGAAMAASYLGPATLMQPFASVGWMWNSPPYDPYNWALLRPDLWPFRPFSEAMAWLGWGTGALGLAALVAVAGRTVPERLREAALWGAVALAGWLLYALPWVWHGPTGLLLGKAQFAYRVLLGMEFAAVTAIVLAAAGGRWRRVLLLAALCLIPLKHGLDLTAEDMAMNRRGSGDHNRTIGAQISARFTPQEHLPAGVDLSAPRFRDLQMMSGFSDLPDAAPTDPSAARIVRTGVTRDGTMIVAVDAGRPATIVVKRFYFPTWRAYRVQDGRDPEVAVSVHGRERLLAFQADAGAHTYRIRIERSTVEKVCDALSVLAILVGLALLVPSLAEGLKKIRKAAI